MGREDTAKLVGKLAPADAGRDAIHVAVAPVVAAEQLYPGQHVGLNAEGEADGTSARVGVVDPYYTDRIFKGERFFLFLYPGSISSLRHVWEHAAFAVEGAVPVAALDDKAASEQWLRAFAKVSDCPSYDVLIAAAAGKDVAANSEYHSTAYENDGEFLTFYGRDAHGEIPPEFWHHVEVATGVKIPSSKRAPFFSCSC
jgi:hypothetical protein